MSVSARRLVYAGSIADEALREQLSTHLQPLVQDGLIIEWYEQLIPAGTDKVRERQRAWQEADILLLMLSADFFLSGVFGKDEMREALARHQAGQIRIMPVLLRPCDWQATLLGSLQCLPRNGNPVTRWDDRDEAMLSIVQEIRHLVTLHQAPPTPLSVHQRTNRDRLLKQVHTVWIKGLLEQSLQHAVWVDLHLQKQPDALENPWRLMVQELDREPRPLPPGTSILQVFDEADEELLILGEPGSGKTTLLLYLARTLLERASRDEHRRIPVIFNLSSWARLRLPLDQWLLEELQMRYQVPRPLGQAWIDANQIFPLLDGLDEVAESVRASCAQRIIDYVQRSHERTPLIVCCRTEEYRLLAVQMPLQYAVVLLPFSDEQIEVYLSSVSGQLDVLRQMLQKDRDLFDLAHRPLMLSIFTLAYHGEFAAGLPATPVKDEYPRALFSQYVKHMLKRRARLQLGTEEQATRWLTYFATQMHTHQQTIFSVEELQPSWLPRRYSALYRWGMAFAFSVIFGLFGGVSFCLTFGFVYGLMYRTIDKLIYGAVFGLLLGLAGGLAGGLAFGIVFRHYRTIQPVEITGWSWSSARKGLLIGGLGGLIFGLAGGLIVRVIAGLAGGIVVGCAVVCAVSLVGGLVGGLAPMQMPERLALSPNEGIWRSGRRGLFAILVFAVCVGLAAGLIVSLFGAFIGSPVYGLLIGLIVGSGAGLLFGIAFNLVGGRTGLAAFVQHFVLRLFLWRLGLLPWQLVAFLDEATERLLLRKVGGSYIFVHRLLRDVLATQDTQPYEE